MTTSAGDAFNKWMPAIGRSLSGILVLAILSCFSSPARGQTATTAYLKKSDEWFRSAEGREITANILSWQSVLGSWPKNQDNTRKKFTGEPKKIEGTFDNRATTDEIRFLARAFQATHDEKCHEAAVKGINLILKAQYPNGGWPQYYPPPKKSYNKFITFNDDSMVRLLELLREVSSSADFAFLDSALRKAAGQAFDRGIDCILKCQVKVNGQLTVWCAQHDDVDLSPRAARTFELASLSGGESAGILRLLMTLDHPSPEVERAIRAGAEWFEKVKITGVRYEIVDHAHKLVPDASAPPIWARFYDIETGKPLFADRDGVKRWNVSELGDERREGYAWYGVWGKQVAREYAAWLKKRPAQPE